MRRISITILLASSLVACKGKDDKAAGSASSTTAPAAPSAGSAAQPPENAPTAPVQTAIDVCSFAARDQVEALIGKLGEDPKPTAPQGSLLGGCEYSFEGGLLVIHARPANEYDATVKAMGGGSDVAGVGEKAYAAPKAGLFVQPAGKQYFLHILGGGAGLDDAKKLEVAKLVTTGAK